MNANEMSPTVSARLKRIRTVSRIFRGLLGFYAVVIILILIGYELHVMPSNPPAPQPVSRLINDVIIKPGHASAAMIFVDFVRFCLFVCGMILMNRLFNCFERGRFFTHENVRYVRWIGLLVVGDWAATFCLDLLSRAIVIRPVEILTGLLVVLISWIADEARKIQEEQELTV